MSWLYVEGLGEGTGTQRRLFRSPDRCLLLHSDASQEFKGRALSLFFSERGLESEGGTQQVYFLIDTAPTSTCRVSCGRDSGSYISSSITRMPYKDQVKCWHEGVLATEKKDLDSALKIFISIEDPSSKIWFNIGCIHLLREDFPRALQV